MRINEVKGLGSTSSIKKKSSKSGDSGFSDLINEGVDESTEAQALSGVGALTSLDGLLAVQEVDPEVVARKKQIMHGQQLIDFLDELRHGMLVGGIPVGTVQRLLEETKKKNDYESDPQLKQIIDEIELRAEVELAKIEVSRTLV